MKVEYSSTEPGPTIYTTVTLREDVKVGGVGKVEVGCIIEYSDSRNICAERTKTEAIRLLNLALKELEAN